MAMGCGPMCAKIILFVFNFIFWLSGLGLVAIGILILVEKDFSDIEVFLPAEMRILKYLAAVLICLGIFILVIGFCGCCGAVKESKCLLGLYIFFLVIIMAAEIAVGVYVVLKKSDIETNFTKEALRMLNYYPADNSTKRDGEAFKISVDQFQSRVKCCGILSNKDWLNTTWYAQSNALAKSVGVPKSCCPDFLTKEMTRKVYGDCSSTTYTKGCKGKTMQMIRDKLPIIIGVGFGVAFLEILGFVLSVCLCRAIGKEDASNYY